MGIPEALLARVKLRARATSTNKAMSCSAMTAGDRTTNGLTYFLITEIVVLRLLYLSVF
jgi:hypothetical protein